MNLKEYIKEKSGIINEMSMPNYKNPEEAVDTIKKAYQAIVVKKQPQGDYYGPLSAALKYISSLNNPEKYSMEIKKGKAALKAMNQYKNTKGSQQAKF